MGALPDGVRARVGAVVLFGYTQNEQLDGGVPGVAAGRVKVYCNFGDLVCRGSLVLTAAHFTYASSVSAAVLFIATRLGSV